MLYFWFIPALVVLLVLLWILYGAISGRASERTEGRTLLDKPSRRRRGAS
jgi:hypothetical protein